MAHWHELLQALACDRSAVVSSGAIIEPLQHLGLDSRQVQPGDIFFAYPGEQSDGRAYWQQAVARGAAAIVYEKSDGFVPPSSSVVSIGLDHLATRLPAIAERFYQHPAAGMTLIGVTGTNGKTSITHLLAQALTARGEPCGVLGTVGNGVWPALANSTHTTPDPLSLMRYLRAFRDQGCHAVVMEVSSHALMQNRLGNLAFQIGVFTHLTQDHLDFHGTMAAYAAAKARLFSEHVTECAILNADDSAVTVMQTACRANVAVLEFNGHVDTRTTPRAAVHLLHHQALPQGFAVNIASPWGEIATTVPLLGLFNLSNILAVVAVLGRLGWSASTITQVLPSLRGVRGRMEWVHQAPQVLIDYAHTPDALAKALRAARAHCQGRLWVVFGCGGNRDRSKRPLMAALAEQCADRVVVTEDNPRFEAPSQILEDIMAGFARPHAVQVELDRERAIQWTLRQAKPNDCILLAGKGHECYIITQGQQRLFDERQVVAAFYTDQKRELCN